MLLIWSYIWDFHQIRCTSPCTGPDTKPPVTETCAKLYRELAVNEEMAKAIMHETVMNRVLNTTSEYRVNGGRVHLQWLAVKFLNCPWTKEWKCKIFLHCPLESDPLSRPLLSGQNWSRAPQVRYLLHWLAKPWRPRSGIYLLLKFHKMHRQ